MEYMENMEDKIWIALINNLILLHWVEGGQLQSQFKKYRIDVVKIAQ